MALAREPRDTSKTLLAAHNSINPNAAAAAFTTTTNSIAYSRPSTAASVGGRASAATSTITETIAAANHPSPRRAAAIITNSNTNAKSNQLPSYPNPPFILGHSYGTEWKTARQVEAARLKLVPRTLRQDTAGPMSYPLSTDGFEKLSTSKGRPFGGEVDGHYANFAAESSTNNNNAASGAVGLDSPRQRAKHIRGICTFGNTPRMISGDIHNEMCKASGHRPNSAANRLKSPRSQQTDMEKKYGPLRLGMTDGTSLPGSSYRKVFITPAAGEYDVKRATSLTKATAPRCSFGTCARFDGGSEASARCRPSSARNTNNNQVLGAGVTSNSSKKKETTLENL